MFVSMRVTSPVIVPLAARQKDDGELVKVCHDKQVHIVFQKLLGRGQKTIGMLNSKS